MTNAEHTPGPWRVEPLQWDHGASIAIVANGQIIATISPENEDEEPDMHTAMRGPHDEANASLIAAAPAMLEALQFQEMAEHDRAASARKGYFEEAARLRRAAIAQANGGSI
jgi:hypothetical protein